MIEQKHPVHLALALGMFILLGVFSFYRLYEYVTLESLQYQIGSNFSVIYLSTSHMVSVSGLILMPTLTLFMVSRIIFKSSAISVKWIGCATAIALLVAIMEDLLSSGDYNTSQRLTATRHAHPLRLHQAECLLRLW